ncbi:MAG TPA: fatty acid desaturase [Pararhizobium sp.]|jgi:fatty acid desaturase|nr:fatty acid desaturase [Pararhizobium sp.]
MRDRAEWRTLGLIAGCYGAWLAICFLPLNVPDWLRLAMLIPVITFHSSLQHECLHGHPFRRQALNDLIVWPPLGLFVPYPRFKATHLKHHGNENITDPYDDPESWYVDKPIWQRRPWLVKRLFLLNNTLLGRITLGPAIGFLGFLSWELAAVRNGDRQIARDWGVHVIASAILLVLIGLYSQVGAVPYAIAAYAGMGLLMVRTFLEHQAHERARSRSVIIEDRGPLALLFLNNNLHSVHHAYPSLAWYQLPGFFRANRERFLKMNGGYRYDNYGTIFRRFAFRRKEPVEYPLERHGKGR